MSSGETDRETVKKKLEEALTPFSKNGAQEKDIEKLREKPENLYQLIQRILAFYFYWIAIQHIKNLCAKHNEKNATKLKSLLLNEFFYSSQIFLCVNSIIIELAKLFQENDPHSFKKVIELLPKNSERLRAAYKKLKGKVDIKILHTMRNQSIAHNEKNIFFSSFNTEVFKSVVRECYALFLLLLKEGDRQTHTIMGTDGLWCYVEDSFLENMDFLFSPLLPTELAESYKKALIEELTPFKKTGSWVSAYILGAKSVETLPDP